MHITKIGHACLLIEQKGLRILIDPGTFATIPQLKDIAVVLITHEHPDHIDPDALQRIIEDNPSVEIVTNQGVGKMLESLQISYTTIADQEEITRQGVSIQSIGHEHACIHPDIPLIANSGFYIDKYFFYPGDAFVPINESVTVLALPVSAPWMRIEECIEYAKQVMPKVVFPVHDGMLRSDRMSFSRRIPTMLLEPAGIRFVDMHEGWSEEF
jgi:L-ascorbate metabolism protein UlaG (beta-lactamase superfamily)